MNTELLFQTIHSANQLIADVHRIHTRSVHHEHYSHLTSTDYICTCGSRLKNELQRHLCAHGKSLTSGQPCHLFVGLCLAFSLPVHHNTKQHLDSTTFSKTTLCAEHLFHNLSSRQAAPMNRSRTSSTRVAETRATPLPQFPKAQSLDQFWKFMLRKFLMDLEWKLPFHQWQLQWTHFTLVYPEKQSVL